MRSLRAVGLVVVLGVAMLLAVLSVVAAPAAGGTPPIFADDFEGTLSAWTVLTLTFTDTVPTNQAIITTSPVHSGVGAAAVIRVTADYAALSTTIAPASNVRARAWVYDFDNEASGGFESIWTPTSPGYTGLVVSPRSVFTDSYALRFGTQWIQGPVRSPGWHQFDVIVTDRGAFGRIDGRVLEFDVPLSQTRAIWLNEGQTRTQWIKAITPWTNGPFVFDDVAVTAPPSTTDELLLAVKDDFIDLYGATDFSVLYPTLGATNTIPCLPDMRSLAGTAMAFALDAHTDSTGRAAQSRQKAIQLISDTLTYGQWAYDDIHTTGLFYCNSATSLELALTAWIMWPDLSPDLRAAVKARIVAEADRYVGENAYPHSGYQGDSKIEENALAAEFFAIVANMFPAELHAPHWESLARCFAFHSITNRPTTACGYTTQTVYTDFKVDNHGLSPNPHYADSGLQELAGGALAYRAAGQPLPLEFASNVAQLWQRQKQDIDWGRTYYYRVNADWGSQGWSWMGGSIAAFLRFEPATYDNGMPLITAADEYQFLQTRWLLNDGRVAVFTQPVATFTETLFSPGTTSQAWFLNANQVQAGFIWGYLYHHPELLARTTVVTPSLYLPGIVLNHN